VHEQQSSSSKHRKYQNNTTTTAVTSAAHNGGASSIRSKDPPELVRAFEEYYSKLNAVAMFFLKRSFKHVRLVCMYVHLLYCTMAAENIAYSLRKIVLDFF